jgi:hypothetical protein
VKKMAENSPMDLSTEPPASDLEVSFPFFNDKK